MNKKQILQLLQEKIASGEISREEVQNVLNSKDQTPRKRAAFSITKMLYVIGAAIVIMGIMIFVSQIWEDINSFGRILITLGLGMLLAFIGSLLLKQKSGQSIGPVFHAIAGFLIPSGAMVTLTELSSDTTSIWPVTITYGVIFLFYLILTNIHKHVVLTFFAITNGTTFTYLVIATILEHSTYSFEDIYVYVTMVIGACYILLAQSFHNTWNKSLFGLLCFAGSTAFLGTALTQVWDSMLWQLFYFVLIAIGLLVSVYLRSRAILVMSTLFLIVHVSYITGKYFADSLGWPISLVILGFIFIGLGYSSFKINKKYIQ